MNCICAILLLLISTLVSAEFDFGGIPELKADLSDLVDVFVPYVSQLIVVKNLDPLAVPDIHENVKVDKMFLSSNAKFDLKSGIMHGASRLYRNRPATVVYNQRYLQILTGFGFHNLTARYQYCVKLSIFGQCGIVITRLENLKTNMDFTFDLKEYEMSLKRFEIEPEMNMFIRLEGNDMVDWLTNMVVNQIATNLRKKLVASAEVAATKEIQKNLIKFNQMYFHRPANAG